jgi:hypothetical protein
MRVQMLLYIVNSFLLYFIPKKIINIFIKKKISFITYINYFYWLLNLLNFS